VVNTLAVALFSLVLQLGVGLYITMALVLRSIEAFRIFELALVLAGRVEPVLGTYICASDPGAGRAGETGAGCAPPPDRRGGPTEGAPSPPPPRD
jgi:hypothetical protein